MPIRVVLALVPGFSLMSVACAIDPLRIANRVSGRVVFEWEVAYPDDDSARASSGFSLRLDPLAGSPLSVVARHPTKASPGSPPRLAGGELQARREEDNGLPGYAFVVAGLDVERGTTPGLKRWLRRVARQGVAIGGISTGAWVLAAAGLLDGRPCTLHWENLPAFAERFPTADARQELCVIDGNLLTCAGGTAALDMMLHVIARHLGSEAAAKVADQLILPAVRPLDQRQRVPLARNLRRANTRLAEAMRLMEDSIAQPILLDELPARIGLSRRQVERLFRRELDQSPARYFLTLRLERARHLLAQTEMPIIEIAIACGFVSASHFSKCFRRAFGQSPQSARTQGYR